MDLETFLAYTGGRWYTVMAKGVDLNEKNHVYNDLGSSPFPDCL